MAEAAEVEYSQKDGAFGIGHYVAVAVQEQDDKPGRTVHGVITAKGTDQNDQEVPNTWNLTIPGWDTLHGQIDPITKKPKGGHIYDVRPIACSVPEDSLKHAKIPKVLNVYSEGAKKERINGDYHLDGDYSPKGAERPDEAKRPMWKKAGDPVVVIVHKPQKAKPAWIITKQELLDQDGGYALFAQDLWMPSDRDNHLRGEVWGNWDPEAGKWKADQSLFVTNGPGKKPDLMAKYKKKLEDAGK